MRLKVGLWFSESRCVVGKALAAASSSAPGLRKPLGNAARTEPKLSLAKTCFSPCWPAVGPPVDQEAARGAPERLGPGTSRGCCAPAESRKRAQASCPASRPQLAASTLPPAYYVNGRNSDWRRWAFSHSPQFRG